MEHQEVSADEALGRLREGNERFTQGKLVNQVVDVELMQKLTTEGQDPWVLILTCIDSRIVPQWIFDFKLGDAFIARTIGNVADLTEFCSVWYAVKPNKIRLVVVLGHSVCGAVQHTIKGERTGECIDGIVDMIKPAVEAVAGRDGDNVRNVVTENAEFVARKFREHPDFAELSGSGEFKVVPAYYDLATGQVGFKEE